MRPNGLHVAVGTFLICAAVLVSTAARCQAAPVTRAQVIAAANTFLEGQRLRWQKSPTLAPASAAKITLAGGHAPEPTPVTRQKGEVLAFVVELQPEGFIILSGDTDIRPILGYSFKGRFPFVESKDNALLHLVKWDLEARLTALKRLGGRADVFEQESKSSWKSYVATDQATLAAIANAEQWGPWVQTQWDQGGFYNDHCPEKLGFDCAAGCTAVAMGQILNYWKYPSSASFSSSADHYMSGAIDIDGDAASHDFPTFGELNTSLSAIAYDGSQDEIANLLFGVGIKLQTDYGILESSACQSGGAYTKGFTYGSALDGYQPDGIWATRELTAIENIKRGWPVQIGIRGPVPLIGGSHSVVCDGYNSGGEFHVNMGWGGMGTLGIVSRRYLAFLTTITWYTVLCTTSVPIKAGIRSEPIRETRSPLDMPLQQSRKTSGVLRVLMIIGRRVWLLGQVIGPTSPFHLGITTRRTIPRSGSSTDTV